MGERGSTSTALAVVVGLALGAALSPVLGGCVIEDTTLGRVIGAMGGNRNALSEEGSRQLMRFQAVYNKFSVPGDDASQLEHFGEAFKRVRVDYVRETEDVKLIDAAIEGVNKLKPEPSSLPPPELVEAALDAMLASLDPHSTYLNPQELRNTHISTKGEFGGLGIEILMEDSRVKVISPIEGTPAYRAGIKPNDIITHLDGDPIEGMSLAQAVQRMRGRPGTDIRLTVSRAGHPPFQVTITRAIIRIQSVRWQTEGDIGYIRVASFTEKVKAGVEEAMAAIHKKLGDRMRGVVLDLRNNPGGLLDQSVALADSFLETGVVVSVRGRGIRNERTYKAEAGDLAHGLPIVVLINGGSASASEIVALALQDNGRATVLGVRSFGKGTVQTITPLPLEGALRLTTALYYSPSGITIQAHGVYPDIVIITQDPDKRQRESDLPGALTTDFQAQHSKQAKFDETDCPAVGDKEDRQLGCALALLRAGSAEEFLASAGRRSSM